MSRKPNEGASESKRGASDLHPPAPAPTIVVPLDGTAQSLAAWPVAKGLAQIEGATLRIVHVGEAALPPREAMQKLGLTPEQLRGAVIEQAAGTPATTILRLAGEWRSQLIVMCTRTGTDKARDEMGSVAEGILSAAARPVVLVRPERGIQPWELHRILLPHEGTPTTAAAVGPAASLAHQASAELIVLHIAEPGAARPAEPGTFAGPRYMDQPQHEWPVWAKEFIQRLRGLGQPPAALKLRLLLATGRPGEAIVRSAGEQNADLIVLAWRGHLEARRAATLKEVIHNAPCPVLVVPVTE